MAPSSSVVFSLFRCDSGEWRVPVCTSTEDQSSLYCKRRRQSRAQSARTASRNCWYYLTWQTQRHSVQQVWRPEHNIGESRAVTGTAHWSDSQLRTTQSEGVSCEVIKSLIYMILWYNVWVGSSLTMSCLGLALSIFNKKKQSNNNGISMASNQSAFSDIASNKSPLI